MVALPNIKINSEVIDDFESPVSDIQNANKYLKINDKKKITYSSIESIISDIVEHGGIPSGGETQNVTINDWKPNTEYHLNDLVIYQNALFQCKKDLSSKDIFDYNDWTMIAGFFKDSQFFYDDANPISEIILKNEIPNKNAISINLNNLVLQSNNYYLDADNKTIKFVEPILPKTNIEVTVYGNMILPTDITSIKTKVFNVTEDNKTQFELGDNIEILDFVTVNIENTVIMQSEYHLENNGSLLVLHNPVSRGTRVQISYFNNVKMSIGGTFIPKTERNGITTTLSWTNDIGLKNPENAIINDGATFTPKVVKEGIKNTMSWTNNAGLKNPENALIYDGVTFTPTVTHNGGVKSTISWSNDGDRPNPDNIEIVGGVTYTPSLTEKQGLKSTLSWTNDGGRDNNPKDLVISDGITFTPSVVRDGNNLNMTWSNDGEVENPASVVIQDGATFTPSLTEKQGLESTLSWSNDRSLPNPKDLVISDGVTFTPSISPKQGLKSTLSWINNGNKTNPNDLVISDGVTFTPSMSQKQGLESTLSWSNDGGKDNPTNLVISDGVTFTPHVVNNPFDTVISWTNDGGKDNPADIKIDTRYSQRVVDSFTASAEQKVFVASQEIYDKCLLSVNVGNTDLTYSAFELGADKKTVTLVNGVKEGTLVDLKYFNNIKIAVPAEPAIATASLMSEPGEKGDKGDKGDRGEKGDGITFKGKWNKLVPYSKGDMITFEDTTTVNGYVALKDVPVNTDINNIEFWGVAYKIDKTLASWGNITGTITNQKDLKNELDKKQGSLDVNQMNAVNSGITAELVGNYNAYGVKIKNKQDVANMVQVVDDNAEASKYPSALAIKNILDSLPKHVVVTQLPENPDPNTFYYIKKA